MTQEHGECSAAPFPVRDSTPGSRRGLRDAGAAERAGRPRVSQLSGSGSANGTVGCSAVGLVVRSSVVVQTPEAHLPTPAQFRELPSDFSAPEGRCATNGPHYAGFFAAFFFFLLSTYVNVDHEGAGS